MTETVTLEIEGPVALIAFDNPPVNAASHALRQGLAACLARAQADDAVRAIALYGRGRCFIAGADIREFGRPAREPLLPALVNRIETSDKPVVAVLHGVALGGGFEVALGAHARIALEGTRLGFPEVGLGILPGAGGTQRAPRLAGIKAAIELITTGRQIDAAEAAGLGLVDRVTTGEPRAVALAAAREALEGSLPTRAAGRLDAVPDPAAVDAAKARIAATQPHLLAPLKCVEAIEASTRPLEQGMKVERALFLDCMESPQRAGLIHAFFAERATGKIPEADATPRAVNHVGVIGGGTMGSGIATAALLAGLTVTLNERCDAALARGRDAIVKNLAGAVDRGKLTAQTRDAAEARLTVATALEALGDVDLAIEAVFEDMDVKKAIFRRLDRICKPGAVLATNTSYLDIDSIAAETSRPADVLGLHFFSPAHVMRLLEVVVADKTAPEVTATGFALARRLKKVPVRAGVCDGFIGNRILTHYRKAADYMVLDGAAPEQIDDALEGFGFAMGPFRVADLAGGDIGWATRKRRAPDRPATERYVEIGDRIAERGWFGRKTGRGYYDYSGDRPVATPELAGILASERDRAGIAPRAFSDPEIVERYMTAMIAESARVLEEGIARRPIDIDATFLFGYGFPRFRGGPLFYADTLGAKALVSRIEAYAREDPHYWQVPDPLRRMAADGTGFAALNQE